MESDQEDNKSRSKSAASDKQDKDHNISHEDLSDVSDDSDGPDSKEKDKVRIYVDSDKFCFWHVCDCKAYIVGGNYEKTDDYSWCIQFTNYLLMSSKLLEE